MNRWTGLAATAVMAMIATAAVAAPLPSGVQFAPRSPVDAARAQVADLRLTGDRVADRRLENMLDTLTGTWITGGSPGDAPSRVASVVAPAAQSARMPVVIPHTSPGRDCAQCSADRAGPRHGPIPGNPHRGAGQPLPAGPSMIRITLNMAVRATAPIGPAPVTTTVAPDDGSWAIAVL
jgi:hypothetical protein